MVPAQTLQILSPPGATLVLFAYAASQARRLRPDGLAHGMLNRTGAVAVTVSAIRPLKLGVLILEWV